jgi:hypothetical protein
LTHVGADRDMLRCKLGVAAATPIPNTAAPVTEPARIVYRRQGARND